MKISFRTFEALYELWRVSPTVLLCREGNAFALDDTAGIRATAKNLDRFPRNVAFDDTMSFLAPLEAGGLSDTEVTFDASKCRLTAPSWKSSVAVANASKLRELLRHKTDKGAAHFHALWEFAYGHEQLLDLQRRVNGIKKKVQYEMRLTSDGTTASLAVQWKSPEEHQLYGGFGRGSYPLGKCPKTFAFVFPISTLSLLPSDDYDAVLSAGSKFGELCLTAHNRPIIYCVRVSVSTVETHHAKASARHR